MEADQKINLLIANLEGRIEILQDKTADYATANDYHNAFLAKYKVEVLQTVIAEAQAISKR